MSYGRNDGGGGCGCILAFVILSAALSGVGFGEERAFEIALVIVVLGLIAGAVYSGLTAPLQPRRRETIPGHVKSAVYWRDGGRCRRCGSTYKLEYDHIVPWSRGGSDRMDNLQLLCRTCNRRKGARMF